MEVISNMKLLDMKCDVVTPLFLYGANQNIAELRAPAFKGAIRYWWRAINADLNIKSLREKENKIFGGVSENEEDKASKSKISLHIANDLKDSDKETDLKKEISDLNPNYGNHQGISYLLYSVTSMRKRPYIKAGSGFHINVRIEDDSSMDEFLRALTAFEYFGALGSRARRGAGSVSIEIDDELPMPYKEFFNYDNINNKEDLKHRIEQIGKMIPKSIHKDYSVLKGSTVYIFDGCTKWIDALEKIGKPFKEFRHKKESNIFETPYFGIPIYHKSKRSLFIAENTNNKERINRRASSLIFKILKCSDEKYFPMMIHLNGDFLPQGFKITNGDTNEQSDSNDNIIYEFLKSISNDSLEAKL